MKRENPFRKSSNIAKFVELLLAFFPNTRSTNLTIFDDFPYGFSRIIPQITHNNPNYQYDITNFRFIE